MNAVNKVGIGVIIMPICLTVKSDDSFFGMMLSRIYGFGMIDVKNIICKVILLYTKVLILSRFPYPKDAYTFFVIPNPENHVVKFLPPSRPVHACRNFEMVIMNHSFLYLSLFSFVCDREYNKIRLDDQQYGCSN